MKLETTFYPQSNNFFSIPRELRDEIYAHLFTSEPYLEARFHGLALNLHYGPRCCPIPPSRPTQSWLLTSKTFMTEALEEYARRADWVWHGPSFVDAYTRKSCALPIPKDVGKEIRRMTLYVGNLAHWETPYRNEGMDGRKEIRQIADVMRDAGIRVNTIRLQGHSYSSYNVVPTCKGQTDFILANLRSVFEGVEVRKWEFEILCGQRKRSEVVFDVGPEGELRIVVDERWAKMARVERVHSRLCEVWTRREDAREARDREEMRINMEIRREQAAKAKKRREERKARAEAGETAEGSKDGEANTNT